MLSETTLSTHSKFHYSWLLTAAVYLVRCSEGESVRSRMFVLGLYYANQMWESTTSCRSTLKLAYPVCNWYVTNGLASYTHICSSILSVQKWPLFLIEIQPLKLFFLMDVPLLDAIHCTELFHCGPLDCFLLPVFLFFFISFSLSLNKPAFSAKVISVQAHWASVHTCLLSVPSDVACMESRACFTWFVTLHKLYAGKSKVIAFAYFTICTVRSVVSVRLVYKKKKKKRSPWLYCHVMQRWFFSF